MIKNNKDLGIHVCEKESTLTFLEYWSPLKKGEPNIDSTGFYEYIYNSELFERHKLLRKIGGGLTHATIKDTGEKVYYVKHCIEIKDKNLLLVARMILNDFIHRGRK